MLIVFPIQLLYFELWSFELNCFSRNDSRKSANIFERILREIQLKIDLIEVNYNFGLSRSINLNFIAISYDCC